MPEQALSGSVLVEESALLIEVYEWLEASYELDRWHWREETPPLDVCVGGILVQHTSWANVERALANLREAGVLSLEKLAGLSVEELAALVRPAGTPMTKATRIKAFVALVERHGGLESMLALPPAELRAKLVGTPGIGPETADCICLYAGSHPLLVHDAYTERLLGRLGLGPGRASYSAWQSWLTARLPAEVRFYQRFHAGIVVHCKETCRSRPKCGDCPLADVCAFSASNA
jgi:endonuclease III related protein